MVVILQNFETFLGCFSLETGGKVVAWVEFVGGVIFTLISVTFFTMSVNELSKPHFNSGPVEMLNLESSLKIDAIIGFLATIIGCVAVYTANQLLQGSFERKSRKIKPAIALESISIVFTAAWNFVAWPFSLVPFIIDGYILLFLISLHDKFKDDEKRRASQEPVRTVTISQPLLTNDGPSEPNFNDPATITINSNAFESYNLRPAPNAPPSYGAKF